MPQIELRLFSGTRDPKDILLVVQDRTYDFLMSSTAPEIRISAYLDRDWPEVERQYAEVFVHESCRFESKVQRIIPGSKERKEVPLPGPMEEGEQLTVIVTRSPIAAP
ncbi:MAG: hypothetical protein ACXVBW_00735 [Bdellovibrionota bacterium]